MDFKYEVTVVPVSDVDRAKDFYADKLGFNVDVDHRAGEDFRVVQLTPPGALRDADVRGHVASGQLERAAVDAPRSAVCCGRCRPLGHAVALASSVSWASRSAWGVPGSAA